MIEVSVPSDVATLHAVVVGPVKKFGWRDLLKGSLHETGLGGLHQLRHNRVQIPRFEVAHEEHHGFIETLRQHGVTVEEVERLDDVTIQLYPRDIAFAIDNALVLARSRHPQRRREQHGIQRLLPQFPRVLTLNEGFIEGGDVIVTADDVLVGLSEETNAAGINALRASLQQAGIARRVVPIEFANRGVVHLDTKFTMVAPRVGLWHPAAFTGTARAELERRFDLIEATRNETRNLMVNTLALAPDRVVIDDRSDRIAAMLSAQGITPVPVPYSEITKFPGGFRCATLPLIRR